MPLDIAQPPAIYRHYGGRILMTTLPLTLVDGECKRRDPGLDPGQVDMACASPRGRVCFVVMPRIRDIGRANYARLKAHEFGHCACWAG
jgi:hypothetical protein